MGEKDHSPLRYQGARFVGEMTLNPSSHGIQLSCQILILLPFPTHHLEPLTIKSLAEARLLHIKDEWLGTLASRKEL